MFKRRMLEGSAGYRQLKCNDCHKSSKASGVTLLALRSKRPSLAMLLWDTTIYTGTTSFYLEVLPSLKKKEESFFKKYKLKSVVFSYSWFLTSLLQRANKTKALFWHSIRELSSLQWKLHHFKSRLEKNIFVTRPELSMKWGKVIKHFLSAAEFWAWYLAFYIYYIILKVLLWIRYFYLSLTEA